MTTFGTPRTYQQERSDATAPLWLSRLVVEFLLALHVDMPSTPDKDAAAARIHAAADMPGADVPVAWADALALFSPYAYLDPQGRVAVAESVALRIAGNPGPKGISNVRETVRLLLAAVNDFAVAHR